MITKRTKGFTLLDPVKSDPSSYRTEQQLSNDIAETIRMNTDNRRTNDDIDDISKIATAVRPKVEILRANSPTFKRLVAVRIKLEKYIISISNTISPSQQIISQTLNYVKPSTAPNVKPSTAPNVNIPLSSEETSQKRIESKPSTAPVDKITYEKTCTHNGNIKHKCSLEIWLPKAGSDDEDGNTSRRVTPDPHIIGNNFQSTQSMPMKSRVSSTMKFSATANSETKSFDETSSKKSEPIIIPRVYRYEEYLTDQAEERPRSGKGGNTYKSDGNGSNKNYKRQVTRSNSRHLSPSTNTTEETIQSTTTSTFPMSSRNLLANIKQNPIGSNNSNSTMINELMRKYSMIKRSHQELTQPRLQLEKPYQDPRYTTHIIKDHSLSSPPTSESASYISSDQSIISTKKLLSDTVPPHSAEDHTNTKLIDRRSLHYQPSHSNVYHQTRLFSIVNQLQHRQTSASTPNPILPAVTGRRNEEQNRSFERSKTLDVVLAISNDDTYKIPSRLLARPDSPQNHPNLLPRTINGNEQISPRMAKRSLPPPSHTLSSEQSQQQTSQPLVQLVKYQNIQNTAQRYHLAAHSSSSPPPTTTTDVSTNKVLVHLKYSNSGNTDRNCLIPE